MAGAGLTIASTLGWVALGFLAGGSVMWLAWQLDDIEIDLSDPDETGTDDYLPEGLAADREARGGGGGVAADRLGTTSLTHRGEGL